MSVNTLIIYMLLSYYKKIVNILWGGKMYEFIILSCGDKIQKKTFL